MGNLRISKGEKVKAMALALEKEVGDGGQLTIKQCFQIFTQAFDVISPMSVYNYLEALDMQDYIEWDRTRKKEKGAKCVTVLQTGLHDGTERQPIQTPA